MTRQMPFSGTKPHKVMSPEQFEQIVEAIINGKYSWACVLILRFAGYNPLHYIPYRTYNRLLKENCQTGRSYSGRNDSINMDNQGGVQPEDLSSRRCLSKITDLAYLDAIEESSDRIKAGHSEPFLEETNSEPSSQSGNFMRKFKWFPFF